MGKAIERIFLPLMRMQLPEVRDICMPAEGVFHNLILVSIRKSYPGHARKVMHAIWGLGQAMFSKCIVVVDEDVDVQNVREVAWKALNNIDPQRDIEFVMGPVDSLDHASRLPNYGSKMGVDATRKWPAEGFTRPWPKVIRMDPKSSAEACRRALETGRPVIGQARCDPGARAIVLWLGSWARWLKRRFPLLDELNIPAPIVGGLLYALAMLGAAGHDQFRDGACRSREY